MKTNRSTRFRDPWWLSLPPIEKLILDYIAENCNAGGLIEHNALDWEYALGLQRMPEQWFHAENPGVIYATKAVALDDVQERGLADTMIRRRPIADWPQIWKTINTPPPGMLEKIIPQVVQLGDTKLWYPRFIERYFRLAPDGTGGEVRKIKLDEMKKPHQKAIKLLRKEALISTIKEFYAPNIEIVEAPSSDDSRRKCDSWRLGLRTRFQSSKRFCRRRSASR